MSNLLNATKKVFKNTFPPYIYLPFFSAYTKLLAVMCGMSIKERSDYFAVVHGNREIRVSSTQLIYLEDVIKNFNFYHDAVVADNVNGNMIVDYSYLREHSVKGFSHFKCFFSSFAEPIVTTKQYIEFADLKKGNVVFDLGAYSGLTSILFDIAMNGAGKVISVEADKKNIPACKENFARYHQKFNREIALIEAAIWKDNKGIQFSSEGNMGSSAVEVVGSGRGILSTVPSLTLNDLAEYFNLTRVDFIKCDIEGAELEIFDQPKFFDKFSPKIMIECHLIDGVPTRPKVSAILEKYGYTCEEIIQEGYPLPLLKCERVM